MEKLCHFIYIFQHYFLNNTIKWCYRDNLIKKYIFYKRIEERIKVLQEVAKNYNNFVKFINSKFTNIFSTKNRDKDENVELDPVDIIDSEIARQEENLRQKKSPEAKRRVMDIILFLHLKKKALTAKNKYIKQAYSIIEEEVEDSIYESLSYLNRVPKDLDSDTMKEIHIYKANLYELIEDFEEASNEFKEAIKYDKTPQTLIAYKEYIGRTREVASWNKVSNSTHVINIHSVTKLEDMPKVIERLKTISKYYARSPKSRKLGKRYFREILKMYRDLAQNEPSKYSCKYIEAMLDAVEIFMMPTSLIKEAQDMLLRDDGCKESRVFLLQRIKDMKQRAFIKKSRVFRVDGVKENKSDIFTPN